MTEDNEMENWKQFQGTELGSLLSSIYGNKRPVIQYPKLKTKKNDKKEIFIPGGSTLTATDPRKSTKTNKTVNIPRNVGRSSVVSVEEIDSSNRYTSNQVDYILHRRNSSIIKKELNDIKMHQEHYRPAYIRPISEDKEKTRLGDIFSYKGGKGLPTELTLPIGDTPEEIKRKEQQKQRMNELRAKHNKNITPVVTSTKKLSYEEELADQITREINDRTNYISELKASKLLSAGEEAKIKGEISLKVAELNRLEKHLS